MNFQIFFQPLKQLRLISFCILSGKTHYLKVNLLETPQSSKKIYYKGIVCIQAYHSVRHFSLYYEEKVELALAGLAQ